MKVEGEVVHRHQRVRKSVKFPFSLKKMEFTPDGQRLVLWSLCPGITIWNFEKGEREVSPPIECPFINSLVVDNAGVRFLDADWNRNFFELRDWSFAKKDWRKPALVLEPEKYTRLDIDGDRMLLSTELEEWSTLYTRSQTGEWQRSHLRKTATANAFFMPGTPWVIGLGDNQAGTMVMVDSREDSLLASPFGSTGATRFGQPEYSAAAGRVGGVDWLGDGDTSTAMIWNLSNLTSKVERDPLDKSSRKLLNALDAGGENRGGTWVDWDDVEWYQHWQEFRKEEPDYHRWQEGG